MRPSRAAGAPWRLGTVQLAEETSSRRCGAGAPSPEAARAAPPHKARHEALMASGPPRQSARGNSASRSGSPEMPLRDSQSDGDRELRPKHEGT